ncbi:MAG: VOC family protein [Ignavibacteriae bacterium]|nr:VOC family protein [Ignavibacteriota bacterium]
MSPKHHIGWFELYVNDFEKSKDFFTQLFGWQFNLSQSTGSLYWNIFTGEGSIGGGLMKKAVPEHSGQSVVLYVEIDDIKATLDKAVSFGGSIVMPKTLINENAGYFGLFNDIDGNVIGLWGKA